MKSSYKSVFKAFHSPVSTISTSPLSTAKDRILYVNNMIPLFSATTGPFHAEPQIRPSSKGSIIYNYPRRIERYTLLQGSTQVAGKRDGAPPGAHSPVRHGTERKATLAYGPRHNSNRYGSSSPVACAAIDCLPPIVISSNSCDDFLGSTSQHCSQTGCVQSRKKTPKETSICGPGKKKL